MWKFDKPEIERIFTDHIVEQFREYPERFVKPIFEYVGLKAVYVYHASLFDPVKESDLEMLNSDTQTLRDFGRMMQLLKNAVRLGRHTLHWWRTSKVPKKTQ